MTDSARILSDCHACVKRELTITTYLEDRAQLQAERDRLLEDRDWCQEVIRACLDALHRAHLAALKQQQRYRAVLKAYDELRAQRSAVTVVCEQPTARTHTPRRCCANRTHGTRRRSDVARPGAW